MEIKLVVADIDGTLLDSAGLLSIGALESVRRLRDRGIGFTLCSGRADPGTRPFIEQLEIDLPYIVSGGAAINASLDHSILFQSLLTPVQVDSLVELGTRSASELIFHSPRSMTVLCSDEFWENICEDRWMKKGGWKNVFRCTSAQELDRSSIIHVNYFGQEDSLPRLAKEVDALAQDLSTCIVFSKLEIIDRSAGKGPALKKLCENLKIPIEAVMAIGDGMNDVSMISAAGLGVAMGNSTAELIRLADYLVPGNGEGGFAFAIDHLLSGSLNQMKTRLSAIG